MSYLAPHVREEDRIGGGHPEGLFEAWANWYRRFAIATDATDCGDHAAGRIPVTERPRRRGRRTVGGTLR
ncbi:oxidoreductase [Erwinia amylovora MR1]|nr:oxidoreductase [Erwinia amylovora MR1]